MIYLFLSVGSNVEAMAAVELGEAQNNPIFAFAREYPLTKGCEVTKKSFIYTCNQTTTVSNSPHILTAPHTTQTTSLDM